MAAEIGMALNTVPWSHANAEKLKNISHSEFMDFKIYANLLQLMSERVFVSPIVHTQIKQHEQLGGDKTMYLAR